MVCRNAGNGTLIFDRSPAEWRTPTRLWVPAEVTQHRGGGGCPGPRRLGVAIGTVARQYGLGFIPVLDEHYDFVVPKARLKRPPVG